MHCKLQKRRIIIKKKSSLLIHCKIFNISSSPNVISNFGDLHYSSLLLPTPPQSCSLSPFLCVFLSFLSLRLFASSSVLPLSLCLSSLPSIPLLLYFSWLSACSVMFSDSSICSSFPLPLPLPLSLLLQWSLTATRLCCVVHWAANNLSPQLETQPQNTGMTQGVLKTFAVTNLTFHPLLTKWPTKTHHGPVMISDGKP